MKNKHKIYLLILIFLSVLLLFFRLGDYSLWDTDEPLYSQMAREFNYHNDLLTLYWNGEPWFCHPPLYMWLTMVSGNLFGWNEFAVRFPSALFGVLIIILTYFMGKRFYNEDVGFLSGLILMTSLQVFVQGRLSNLDTLFTFFLMLSTYACYAGVTDNSRRYILFFWLSCALGTLAKGPFALCLPLGLIFLWLFSTKKLKEFKKVFIYEGIIAYVILGGFWYIAGLIKYKTEFYNLVFKYFIFQRVTTAVMDQSGPVYFYILIFIAGFLPWVFLFVPAVIDYFKNRKNEISVFLLIWAVIPFLFFSLVQTKLPNYILFIYPACAIMLANYFYNYIYIKDLKTSLLISLIVYTLFYTAVITSFVLLASGKYPNEYMAARGHLLPLLYIIIGTALFSWFFFAFNKRKYVLPAIIAGTFILYLSIVNMAVYIDQFKPVKPIALKIKSLKSPSEKMIVFTEKFNNSASFVFYMNEKITFMEKIDELKEFLNNNPGAYILIKRGINNGGDRYYQLKTEMPGIKTVFVNDGYVVCRATD
ncbi:MAG: glycosyltransferase family 39 protein [Armatimonadota bacterium]